MKDNKDVVKKVWHETTGTDDFIYIVAWLIMIPAMLFTMVTTLGIGIVACVLAVLLLIGVRLLMKMVGLLRRIEDLLAPADPVDVLPAGNERHPDAGAAGAY